MNYEDCINAKKIVCLKQICDLNPENAETKIVCTKFQCYCKGNCKFFEAKK